MSFSRHSFARTPRSKKSQSITLQASELDPLLQYEEEIRLRHPVLAEFSVGNIDMIDEATLILNKRVKIMICEDTDITQEKTHVIVNSADLSLNHYTGGLAGNIILKGGHSIQKESEEWIKKKGPLNYGECAYTTAGSLPSRFIIHAAGPIWSPKHKKESTKQLRSCVKNILSLCASDQISSDIRSLSIPAISTGWNGVPADICARTILSSCLKFCLRECPQRLQLIRLCCQSEEYADCLKAGMTGYLARQKTKDVRKKHKE